MSLNVYKASAGSGKTYTLALKYIALALATDDCRNFTHILAVTFTNKATGEMKDRILQYLFAIANKGYRTKDDEGFLQQLTNELKKSVDNKDIDEDTIARRAQKTLKAIMHDYDHFKVETIDSFFQSLLTSLAYEMKLTRGFKVDLENDAQITKAVNNLLLTIDQNPDKKLAEKIAHYQDNYMDENSKWDISTELIKFASDFLFNDVIMSHVEDLAKFTSNPKAMSELQGKLKAKLNDIKNQTMKFAQDEALNALFDDDLLRTCNKKTIGTFRSYIKASRSGEMNAELSPTALKAINDPTTLLKKNFQNEPHDTLFQAISKIEELYNFKEANSILYNTCNLTLKKLNSLTLLGAIEHELTKESSESGTFLLSNTPQLFSDLVKEDDSSFIFEKLGTTIHHIMIDEFQDTSRKQWENFKKLLFEMLSQGRECMVVGDVKQSIYRWRGGDWEILKDIEVEKDFKERGIKVDTDPEKKLQADGTKKGNFNYRSLPNIVHFNNDFFKRIAQQEGEGSPIYDIYKDVAQEPKKGGEGFIRIERLPKETMKGDMATEYVMDSLYEKIKELHSEKGNGYNIPYRDMTILVRGNKESKLLINYFNSKNDDEDDKPVFTTEEAFMYASSDMVSTIVYALKYLADPKKDTVSRRLLEDTYLRMVEASKSQIDTNALSELIIAISNTYEGPEASDAKKEDAASNKEVDRLVAQWKDMPIPEIIEQIIQRLHFNDMNDLGQSAYLYSFMDDVIQFVDNNTTDLKTFLKFWDDTLSHKAISTDSEDAISIMTIHKAKGLEKHTVFIPFADFDITIDEKDIVCDLQQITKEENTPQLKDYVGNLPVVPIELGKEMANSLYKDVYEEEHLQQTVDSINTLYVAFTRARANLFIWSSESRTKKRKNSSGRVYKYVDEYVKTVPAEEYHLTCKHPVDNNDNVYEYGVLERKVEKENGNDKGSTNPFSSDKKIDDTTVNLCQCSLQNISFVQSGDSKDYIREVFAKDAVDELADKFAEAKRGTLYHDLFSRIITASDLTPALENMQAEGVINADEAQEMQTVCQKAIDKQAAEGHHWFNGTYEQVYNEREILYRRDNIVKTRRPDRFMVSDDKIVLIDYKFTKEEKNNKAKYQRQVGTYMSDLQAIYHKPVEAYLWYISDDGESSIEAVKPTF